MHFLLQVFYSYKGLLKSDSIGLSRKHCFTFRFETLLCFVDCNCPVSVTFTVIKKILIQSSVE